jgi:hypothetical protein
MNSLRRRVRRLEAIVFPYKKPFVPTERDRQCGRLFHDLINRIDPVYALAIENEWKQFTTAKEEGRPQPPMSDLQYFFSRTVLDHMQSGTPLEFPSVVAEVYANHTGPGSTAMAECKSCRYSFPWEISHCPLCGGEMVGKRWPY